MLNIACIILLSAAILLFFNARTWWGLLILGLAGVAGVAAGNAMTKEPPRTSRSDEDE